MPPAGLILDYVKQDGKQATQLPDRLNFKAYWGGELGITIVHFHGALRHGNASFVVWYCQ